MMRFLYQKKFLEIYTENSKLKNGISSGPTGLISESMNILEEEIKQLQNIKSTNKIY